MAKKRWRLVVSDLGGEGSTHEITVEAEHWMAALTAGRAELGEGGGVPPGSSCAVAPDGKVTILDPVERKRYSLSPDATRTFAPPRPRGPKVPTDSVPRRPSSPPAAASPASAPSAEIAPAQPPKKKKKNASRTVAYIDASQIPKPPGAIPATDASPAPQAPPQTANANTPARPQPATPQPATPQPATPQATAPPAPTPQTATPQTTTPQPATPQATAPPAPTPQTATPQTDTPQTATPQTATPQTATPQTATPQTATPQTATPQTATPQTAAARSEEPQVMRLHSSRNSDPTPESPLRYRERTYVVAPDTAIATVEALLHARLDELKAEMADAPDGKFVNLAAFDHDWSGRPQRPPLVTLEWKDWRGEARVARPLEASRASQPATPSPAERIAPLPSEALPTAPAPRTTQQKLTGRRRSGTDEHDARLAKAFEACQDLFFLESAAEALEFTTKLLAELAPAEAYSACLYDINTDEFRFVSVLGPGAEQRQGEAVPGNAGILGAVAHAHAGTQRIADAGADARYDPGADGRVGVEVGDICYLPLEHNGRLLGIVQALNRQGQPGFSQRDADLFDYVGKQTSEFLFRARIAPDKKHARA